MVAEICLHLCEIEFIIIYVFITTFAENWNLWNGENYEENNQDEHEQEQHHEPHCEDPDFIVSKIMYVTVVPVLISVLSFL